MRYADGPTVEVEVLVEAPASRVWELVTDIELPARFSSEFLGAQWLEPATGPELGARFKGRNTHEAIGEWETTSTVVELEDERVFAYAVGDVAEPSATWRFTIEAEGSRTRLKQSMRMGPGWSGLSIAIERAPDKEERIIARRQENHRANMTATVEGIKALAENR